jgi:DNA-binding LacI/PurR family transcriptional regulator
MVSGISGIAEKERILSATLSLVIINKPGPSDQTTREILRVAWELECETPKSLETVRPGKIRALEIAEHGNTKNDSIAYGCIKAIKDAEFSIPDDVSFFDFDGLPEIPVMDSPLREAHLPREHWGSVLCLKRHSFFDGRKNDR